MSPVRISGELVMVHSYVMDTLHHLATIAGDAFDKNYKPQQNTRTTLFFLFCIRFTEWVELAEFN